MAIYPIVLTRPGLNGLPTAPDLTFGITATRSTSPPAAQPSQPANTCKCGSPTPTTRAPTTA